jgi:hypothetical protein
MSRSSGRGDRALTAAATPSITVSSASSTSPDDFGASTPMPDERLAEPVQQRAELEELEQPLHLVEVGLQAGLVEVDLDRSVAWSTISSQFLRAWAS